MDGKVEHLFWKQRRSESFCLLQSDSVYCMSSDFIVRADWQVILVYTVIPGNFVSVLETNFYHQWNVTTMKVFQVKRRVSPALNILMKLNGSDVGMKGDCLQKRFKYVCSFGEFYFVLAFTESKTNKFLRTSLFFMHHVSSSDLISNSSICINRIKENTHNPKGIGKSVKLSK